MRERKLLDCTLRDGGYVNDWEFGKENIVNIFERLVGAGVDIIEVGFLDDRRAYDPNRTIFPDTESLNKTFSKLDPGNSMVVAMIDYGTCAIDRIQPQKDTCLDGIRVIFKKAKMKGAIEFCAKLKALGYKVFANAVSITSYNDRELLDLVDLVNDIEPYAMSMVDTYGLMHEDHVLHYFSLIDYNLKPGIMIGYHSHNNFQMAYSNSIQVLKAPASHSVNVDASLYGMGKSAGNLPIELMAMYMDTNMGKNYGMSQLMETIDLNIMPFFNRTPWGYKLFFYIAASNQCHPNYVKQLMEKQTLSLSQINELLQMLQGEKKLLYDKDYMENLYQVYQGHDCSDDQALAELTEYWKDRDILLIGPGRNVENQKDRVDAFVSEHHPEIISINYLPLHVKANCIFISNSKRYMMLNTSLAEMQEENRESKENFRVIATSNVTKMSGHFDYTLNYSTWIDRSAEIVDNSFVMLLRVLAKCGVKKVFCAGFDGYSEDGKNYFNAGMDYRNEREKRDIEKSLRTNRYVDSVLADLADRMTVEFVTDSRYHA